MKNHICLFCAVCRALRILALPAFCGFVCVGFFMAVLAGEEIISSHTATVITLLVGVPMLLFVLFAVDPAFEPLARRGEELAGEVLEEESVKKALAEAREA